MIRLCRKLEDVMNDFNVKKKLIIIYVGCMILPLILTDSVILGVLYNGEKNERVHEFENITTAIINDLEYTFEDAFKVMNNLYVDKEINEFLNTRYRNTYEFFSASQMLLKASPINTIGGYHISNIIIYADNETIINGGHFYRLSEAEDKEWYQKFMESGKVVNLSFCYEENENLYLSSRRKVSLVRKLDYFKDSGCTKILRVDLDYSTVTRKLMNMNYGYDIYICEGDRILYSNKGHSGNYEDFDKLTGEEKIAHKEFFDLYGENINILIMKPESSIAKMLYKHMPILLLLIIVNLFLPMLMVSIVNKSFTQRLWELSAVFDDANEGSMREIENVRGKDEIGILMHNYNRMVQRMNDLIQRVYKNRLERQEIDLARQNAELLALHSQINPHFLFNILESIRMHCVLKGEEITAGMIEKLAVLERQIINWASDHVTIQEEINFIEAYLELQKYRFGDRLRYEINLSDECAEYYVPKLTLTTFVENSCVHGMEKKVLACWIYVRVYRKNEWVYIEIEDTGGGMEEDTVEKINNSMRDCRIEDIKENESVGILNACLRLKMISNKNVEFSLESEMGVGTFMTIKVRADSLLCG